MFQKGSDPEVEALVLEGEPSGWKAAMLRLNWGKRTVNILEEALVLASLHEEERLKQAQIALLLERDRSWVSRRIALVKRLDKEVQEHIRLPIAPGIQTFASRPKKEPVVLFETEPGQQGQMDWSFYTLNFPQSGRHKVFCFSYYLHYSRRFYVDFCLRRNFHSMIRRHRAAFEYFGGVPRECLYHGKKEVLPHWEADLDAHKRRVVWRPVFG